MASPIASPANIAAAEAKLGSIIQGQDLITSVQQLVIALGNLSGGGGGGGGTVTDFIFTDANGIQGSVANSTTTPTLTLVLDDISPNSIGIATAGAASFSPLVLNGTWYSGGSAETTKPQFLIEPAGAASTNWSADGTGIGVNAASGFAGNLIDAQIDASARFCVSNVGSLTLGASGITNSVTLQILGADRSCSMGLSAFGNGLAVIGSTFDIQASGATMRFVDGEVSARYGSIVGIATDDLGIIGLSGAQKLSVYDGVDIANFVRACITAGATSVTLRAERAGSAGSDIDLNLLTAGTGNVILNPLPTSDPGIPGALYKEAGIVFQST
jgi:hypothetical protein